MRNLILAWIAVLLGALLLGPLAGALVAGLRAADGGSDVTMLFNTAPFFGALGVIGGVLLAAGLGVATARVLSLRMASFAAGAVLAWPAWQLGAVEGVLRSARDATPLWTMIFEGVIMILLGVALAAAMRRAARKDDPDRDTDGAVSEQSLRGAAAAILVGALLAWVFAREGLKGQTIAAAGVAAIGGVTVARLTAPRASFIAIIAALLLLSVAGPLVAVITAGGAPLEALYANALFPLARIAPMDWLAGAFLGAPIGLAWSASMIEKRTEQTA